jgi:hypothetical protein
VPRKKYEARIVTLLNIIDCADVAITKIPTVTQSYVVNTLMGLELNCYHHQFYPYLEVKKVVVWKGNVGQYKMFYVVLSDGEGGIMMEFHADT